MLTKKGPFSCHTGQGTALCHVNSGINSISALISQRSGMAYSLTCQKETIYNVLHDFFTCINSKRPFRFKFNALCALNNITLQY